MFEGVGRRNSTLREVRLIPIFKWFGGAILAGLICTALALFLHPAEAQSSSGPTETVPSSGENEALRDVEALCTIVDERYAYIDSRRDVWAATCEAAQVDALSARAQATAGHLALLERMLDQLWDNHVSLNTNSASSPRLVPSGSDYWLDYINGEAVVTAVRPGTGAARAGLDVGDTVSAINGAPILSAAIARIRHGRKMVSEARLIWAMNAQAAGMRGQSRTVTVSRAGRSFELDLMAPDPSPPHGPVTWRRLEGNIGYIRFEDSLGDKAAIAAFDGALRDLRGVKGWIVDLRNTPGGGNTGVAEPVLGRFIRGVKAYQKAGPRWTGQARRFVASRGPWRVRKRVAVLAGRWTGSMGEGLAIGFDGLRRARVFGSPMAGLAGGIESFELPGSGWSVRIPTYDLFHIKGMQRHHWRPPYEVTADNGDGRDLALEAALDWLR